MKKLIMIAIVGQSLLISLGANASVTDGKGTWKGTGAAFSLQGQKLGKFQIDMTSEAVSATELKSTVTIKTGPDTKTYSQVLSDAGANAFHIESSQGNGGGFCFGKGLCEAYLGTASEGYAITIVLDGADRRRMLVTELHDGKAIGFVRESLERMDD